MKKLLSLFIALVMSFTLVFGTVACNKNNGNASTGTTESSDTGSGSTTASGDTGSGSTTESNSGSQSGEETAKEIKVDYVHAKFTATLKSPSATDVATETALEDIKGDVYVKFIGTEVEFAVNADAFVTNLSDATGNEKANVKLDVRYVGGVLYGRLTGSATSVNGQDENGEPVIEKNELNECDVSYVGTLEEVFAYLTAMSEKVDESASVGQQLVMSQIPAIIDAVKQTIAARGKLGQLGLKSYPQITFDVKTQIIDKVLAFVEENAEVDLLTIIAKLTGEKDSAVLEERLKKIFDESKGEATVADVVDRLVAFVNSYTAMSVDLKAMCDGIQAEAGLTTVDAVAFVKEMLKSQAGMTDEQINDVLPAVADGQTIYDYVYAIAKKHKVNDIIKMFTASKPGEPSPDVPDAQAAEGDAQPDTQPDAQPDAGESITFGQIGEQAIGFLKGTTLSQAFSMVAGDLTLAKWLEMAKGVVEKLELTSEFAVNANGYPTKIANSVAYRINLKNVSGDGKTDVIVAGTAAAAFDIDYAETVPADKASMFVIPAEGSYPAYLKLAQFGLTKAQTEKALKEGLKVEIVPANGEYAEWEISVKTSDAAFASTDNTITYNGKKVVYVENGTLVFDAEFFKAVETEKRTVEVAFGMKSAKGGERNVIYSFSPITDTAEHA